LNAADDRASAAPNRFTAPVVVLVAVLAIMAGIAATTAGVHRANENRLLDEQVAEAAAVVTASIGGIEAPLAAAARLAASDASPQIFDEVLAPSIESGRFVAAELWTIAGERLATTGEAAALSDPSSVQAMIEQARSAPGLALIDTLDLPERRLGFAYANEGHVVYAEEALPQQRTGNPRSIGPFRGLEFAWYLGAERDPRELLYSSAATVPMQGVVSEATVPFGDGEITLVGRTDGTLGSELAAWLPFIVVVGGSLLALLAALVTDRLVQSRRRAEGLAERNQALFVEQRHHADTLRKTLLPRHLPQPDGLEVAASYWPADASNEVGGDFYDMFEVDRHTWAVAIGDVCGKGIDAAALTSLARHTIRAAARHLDSPADVLTWVHEAIAAEHFDTYCTLCFGFIHVDPAGDAWVELSLGGHPAPVLVHDRQAVAVGEPGTILGLVEPEFRRSTHHLDAGDVLVLYTDGVTDAIGRQSMSREELSHIIELHCDQPLTEMNQVIGRELERRRPHGNPDDTALLVIRVEPRTGRSSPPNQ
jgi:serine phosphatase RsbU (regulator of sigma subunit)